MRAILIARANIWQPILGHTIYVRSWYVNDQPHSDISINRWVEEHSSRASILAHILEQELRAFVQYLSSSVSCISVTAYPVYGPIRYHRSRVIHPNSWIISLKDGHIFLYGSVTLDVIQAYLLDTSLLNHYSILFTVFTSSVLILLINPDTHLE